MSTDTLTKATPQHLEPGDEDRFSHYVRKDDIMKAAVEGTNVIALCGKVWTPGRDPNKFQKCPECVNIYENIVGSQL